MQKSLMSVPMMILLLGTIRSGWGQDSRLYPIFELTDEDIALIDVTDGSVEDWLEVVGGPTLTVLDFDCRSPSDFDCVSYDPANLDFRIWLGWHQTTSHLYVAMERADDLYFNNFGPDPWMEEGVPPFLPSMSFHDSSIHLWVDADHSGGQFVGFSSLEEEENLLLTNQQAQGYEAIAKTYHQGGAHVELQPQSQYEDWFFHLPYAKGGGYVFGENPTLSVTEFYVTPFDRFIWNSPGESVVSELYPGKVIGLWISVEDRDGPTLMEGPNFTYYLSPLGNTYPQYKYSDEFVDFLLLGPGGELPEDSVVESVSWGRIKASLGKVRPGIQR